MNMSTTPAGKRNSLAKQLNPQNENFTIISNNCWGGFIYKKYNLPYLTPTIGLLIFSDDFIKFCNQLEHYVTAKLEFIPFSAAKYYPFMKDCPPFPIAKLADIEIYFFHYQSADEAKEKWERRCQRINWDHIIYKISQRESFTTEHIKTFLQLPIPNKLCFTSEELAGGIFIPGLRGLIGDETPLIAQYFDEFSYLNRECLSSPS